MKILNRLDLTGMRCLEIGPGSGLMSVAMKSRGASYVAAVDGSEIESCRLAIEGSGMDVDYFTFGLEGIRDRSNWVGSFDFVFSAGLMYHLINPFLLVETAKMMAKDRGLFLLQSLTHYDGPKGGIYLNSRSNINGDWTTFFVPSAESMRGMLTLGLFKRLEEGSVKQMPLFYSILSRSVTSVDELDGLTSFERSVMERYAQNPDYPFGGYNFRAFTEPKQQRSSIALEGANANGVETFEIDLDKEAPPPFPFQPAPRA